MRFRPTTKNRGVSDLQSRDSVQTELLEYAEALLAHEISYLLRMLKREL